MNTIKDANPILQQNPIAGKKVLAMMISPNEDGEYLRPMCLKEAAQQEPVTEASTNTSTVVSTSSHT
jgi:hypothetical protein